MFIVIAFIFLGIGLGYTVRTRLAAQAGAKAVGTWTARATTWLIWLLLFMLGAEVGGNEQIISALPTLRALKKSPFFMTKTENAYDL